MTSKKKNSYDQPLLSADTEFELISDSVKHKHKHTMPDMDMSNNLELAYSDNTKTSINPRRQPQFTSHSQNPSSKYTINDETETDMTDSHDQRSQRSSTSQMYSRGTNQFEIDYNNNQQINNNNPMPNSIKQSSHSIYTNNNSASYGGESGYQTIEERIQRCGWYIWIIACLCCPIFCPFVLLWYLTTSMIRPRCYMIFTMLLSIIWTWIDEITDIIFIYWLFEYNIKFIKYFLIGCIIFNHFFNLILSLIIRNNWCDDKSVQKQYQYMYYKTIPKNIKYLCLIFIGILNVAIFNIICKTYYLVKNKNNVGTIYIDQRFPCSRTVSNTTHTTNQNGNENNNITGIENGNDKLSKNEKLQKWYNKLYDMEALSIKEMFNTMLEKEAQIYPLLILIQFFETIPKIIIFSILNNYTHSIGKEHHPFILIKLIMAIVSFCAQIKTCFISCANAEFIEQFNHE